MAGPPPARLLSGRDWYLDPYPGYAELRRDWPVARVDWPHRGAGEWLLSRYTDVHCVLAASEFSVRRAGVDPGPIPPGNLSPEAAAQREPLGGTMLSVDPPEHTRLRSPVSRAFTPQRVESLRPRIEAMVEELLEEPTRRGHFDLIRELAVPLPAMAIAELLGVARESIPSLREWTSTYVARGPTFGPGPVSPEVHSAVANLKRCLLDTITRRRRDPQDDLISAMLAAGDPGELLTEQELVNTSLLLLAAGFETTTNLIGNGTRALIQNPDAFDQLADDPEIMPLAVEELLRYDTPVQNVVRVATRDFEVSGVVLPKGAFVGLQLGSANRDPDVFPDPDVLNLTRQPNRHLSFAHGLHFCLGAHLARMTAGVAFAALVSRFKALAFVPKGRKRAPNAGLRGYVQMEVSAFTRGAPSR